LCETATLTAPWLPEPGLPTRWPVKAVAAAARASITHLKASHGERDAQRMSVAATKCALRKAGLPVMPTETHIVPLMVGDPELCRRASELLLHQCAIYIQPINCPTVPRRTERLRITPTPAHDARLVEQLVDSMVCVWRELGLPLAKRHQPSERPGLTLAAAGY
jgi:5-aminolevulinate synthase